MTEAATPLMPDVLGPPARDGQIGVGQVGADAISPSPGEAEPHRPFGTLRDRHDRPGTGTTARGL
jgi:hypothetical protein